MVETTPSGCFNGEDDDQVIVSLSTFSLWIYALYIYIYIYTKEGSEKNFLFLSSFHFPFVLELLSKDKMRDYLNAISVRENELEN